MSATVTGQRWRATVIELNAPQTSILPARNPSAPESR